MRPSALLLAALAFAAAASAQDGGAAEPRTARDWNEAGVTALQGGDLEEALAAFREAHRLAPEDERVARNLARAYGHRGQARLEAGRLADAMEDFEAGRRIHRDGGTLELLAAQVLLRRGKRAAALALVEQVREDFPGNVEAVRLAADLAAVQGDLDRAVRLLEAVADPPEELATRLEQLREERRAWQGFLTDASAHFDLRYDPLQEDLVQALPLLHEDLEEAYQAVALRLGLSPTDRILVLVLDRHRYLGHAPEWSGALYDGRIRLSVGDYEAERRRLQQTLRHEYTHAALHRLGPPLPTWVHEGLAQMVEGKDAEFARRQLRGRGEELPDLVTLAGDWTLWTDRGRVQLAYDYALSLCVFVGEEYGPTAYRLLLEALSTDGFEAAFARTLGRTVEQVDADHRAHLRQP